VPAVEIAAALARLVQGKTPLLLAPAEQRTFDKGFDRQSHDKRAPARSFEREAPPARGPKRPFDAEGAAPRARRDERPRAAEQGFETFRVEVGSAHGVQPKNLVGAIANEAGIDSKHIGRIDIREDHSLIDLPETMPVEIFRHLKKVWVSGQQLRITHSSEPRDERKPHAGKAPAGKPFAGKPKTFKPKSFAPPGKSGGFERPKHSAAGKPKK